MKDKTQNQTVKFTLAFVLVMAMTAVTYLVMTTKPTQVQANAVPVAEAQAEAAPAQQVGEIVVASQATNEMAPETEADLRRAGFTNVVIKPVTVRIVTK